MVYGAGSWTRGKDLLQISQGQPRLRLVALAQALLLALGALTVQLAGNGQSEQERPLLVILCESWHAFFSLKYACETTVTNKKKMLIKNVPPFRVR